MRLDAALSPPGESSEAATERLLALGLGDGLPLVAPTRARVDAMLAGRDPGAAIAVLAPMYEAATHERLAICAVIAGCRPAYYPVLEAAVAAAADDAFNLLGVQTTTGSAAAMLMVHGPIVRALGINAGGNALGPGVQANATIGRALALALTHIGGAVPGELDMATLGQPGKYTFCLAEHEAASPWPPLHAARGLAAADSAVTVFGASGTLEVRDAASHRADALLGGCADALAACAGGAGPPRALVLLAPEHAAIVGREFDRPTATDRLAAHAAAAALRLGRAGPEGGSGPDDIVIAVAGGAGSKSTCVPLWSGSRPVTRAVRPPSAG